MANSRRAAAFAVAKWLVTGEFASSLLPDCPDRAFVQDVVYTVMRRLRPLRRILGGFLAKWPKGELEALLYVGAAQILYMPDVPDFAAVNETVEAAKSCEGKSIPKVVNGVLRNLLRKRDEVDLGTELGTFPRAIADRWTARYGKEAAEKLAAWHNQPAETFLAYRDGRFQALERGRKVAEVPGYAEGDFVVQDPGTAVSISLLDPKRGERVLDACAAPGGKTAQIAWRGASVTACEVNPRRRARLAENLKRLGVAAEVASSFEEVSRRCASEGSLFDKILVDAPCSNTGVFRRRPDARWNWNVTKLKSLVALQAEILDAALPMLAPGGTLVYSTCSNEPEENGDQAAAFLARHKELSMVASKEALPHECGHDGVFAAAFKRKI